MVHSTYGRRSRALLAADKRVRLFEFSGWLDALDACIYELRGGRADGAEAINTRYSPAARNRIASQCSITDKSRNWSPNPVNR